MGPARWYWIVLTLLVLQVSRSIQNGYASASTPAASSPAPSTTAPPVEIVFSFDTTMSVFPVISELRKQIVAMMRRLQKDIPNLRIAVFAHGDYIDRRWHYIIKHIDFTKKSGKIQKFINTVKRTEGGDEAEAYELVLRQVRERLSWTPGSKRALILVGDENPHERDYPKNRLNIDWREEADYLYDMGVRIYAVRALNYNSEAFYKTIAEKTEGFYLRLGKFSNIFDFIMAISYREHGLPHLKAYERELKAAHRTRGLPADLQALFSTLRRNPSETKHLSKGASSAKNSTTSGPGAKKSAEVDIYHYHVRSTIAYRVAYTQVICSLINRKKAASEFQFSVEMPKAAMVSTFLLEVDGRVYPSTLVKKTTGKKNKHKSSKSSHHKSIKDTQLFKLTTTIGAKSRATFNLTYLELLDRKQGIYEYNVYFNLDQVVRDLKVDVFLQEAKPITYLHVPPLRHGTIHHVRGDKANGLAFIDRRSPSSARIIYNPQAQDQKEMSPSGVMGHLVIQYDVRRGFHAGELQVADGYFVHYFAPINMEPANKNVVILVDTSGAMSGKKLKYIKSAVMTLLTTTRPGDYFNVIGYSSAATPWNKDYLVASSKTAITSAKQFVDNMVSAGGSNMQEALLKGLAFLDKHQERDDSADIPMVVMVTHGEPTAGVTDTEKILSNVKVANRGRFPIYSLAVGSEVNFPFLRRLSLQNKAFARRIYVSDDISGQIVSFFREIDTPTMANIRVTYNNDMVKPNTLTTSTFNSYNNGSELIVAGVLKDSTMSDIYGKIKAKSARGPMQFDLSISMRDVSPRRPSELGIQRFAEKLWVLLRIRELTKQRQASSDETEKERLKLQLWQLSKEHSLVTAASTLQISHPDRPYHNNKNTKVDVTDKADNDPHFLINMAGSHTPVCFDVAGTPGKAYQLIHDPITGITVNALFVGKVLSPTSHHKMKTYFGEISVVLQQHHLVVSPDTITIGNRELFWEQNVILTLRRMRIQVERLKQLTVTCTDLDVELVIIRHKVKPNHPTKTDFLGIYINEGRGFSSQTHGLIGQFEKRNIRVVQVAPDRSADPHSAILTFTDLLWKEPVRVTQRRRRNMVTRQHMKCWHVSKNGHGLIDGHVHEYVVPNLKYAKRASVKSHRTESHGFNATAPV